MMARWKVTIEYDGTAFHGWQRQKQGRTVQGELEKAFSTWCNRKIEVTGQGRTDRGVHAEAQTAHLDLDPSCNASSLMAAMRGLLPPDVAVVGAEKVHDDFHARFDALSRCYRYRITTRPSPLRRNTSWILLQQPDPALLYRCAAMLRGEHDFRNFSKQENKEVKNTRCWIYQSEWIRNGDLWEYRVEGNRFLRYMVRRLVGTMICVALGRMELSGFERLLGGKEREEKVVSAPPQGLLLEKVIY